MALRDGTERERYDGPRNVYGDRPGRSNGWTGIGVMAVLIAALLLAAMYFSGGEQRAVTNAPADVPPSVQTPPNSETPQNPPRPAQ
jgi:hypothetical protein